MYSLLIANLKIEVCIVKVYLLAKLSKYKSICSLDKEALFTGFKMKMAALCSGDFSFT